MEYDTAALAGIAYEAYRGRRGVLIACSGGPDSVALLYVSLLARDMGGPPVCACHVEHGIRGEASRNDAALTEALCERLGIKLKTCHIDAPGYAKKAGLSLETAARELRHDALRQAAAEFGADSVAFAHHSGDQAETVLMHILRGSGTAGAAGIRAEYTDRSGLVFLRPLLPVPKQALTELCEREGLPYAVDETNADTAYARNLIRKTLSDISTAYPGAERALCRFAEAAAQDEDYFRPIVDEQAKAIKRRSGMSLIPAGAAALPKSVLYRLLLRELQLYGDMGYQHILKADELLCSPVGSGADMMGCEARRVHGGLLLRQKGLDIKAVSMLFTGAGEYLFPCGSLTVSENGEDSPSPDPANGIYLLSAEACRGTMLRARQTGDRIRPFGMKGSKSVKDYMYDRHIPSHMRDALPVLAKGSEVLWAAGCDISDCAAVREPSEKAFIFMWKEI